MNSKLLLWLVVLMPVVVEAQFGPTPTHSGGAGGGSGGVSATNVVLTGDVTKSAGSTATTIADGAVTAVKIANLTITSNQVALLTLGTNNFSAQAFAWLLTLSGGGGVTLGQLQSATNTTTLHSQGLALSTELVAATNTATLASQGLAKSTELIAATNSTTLASQGMASKVYADAAAVSVTNRPSLYVDRSNVLSGVLTFPSSSNSVTMYPGSADWLLVSATPVSFTNCTGATAGYVCSAYLTTSNSTAAAFTNFCTIPNAFYIGPTSTNAAIIPAAKEAMWLVETRGVNRTNVYGPLISQ